MIYSERLIFEEPKVNDFDRFYEINADPETNFFNPNGAMNFETAKIVFDEILSMLDPVSQVQIVNLLLNVQKKSGISYVFITHDKKWLEVFTRRVIDL